jgi:hypothetical protein
MPTQIDRATLITHGVLAAQEQDVFLKAQFAPQDDAGGIFIRLDNVLLFPVVLPPNSSDDLIPPGPIKIGSTSTLKSKTLVIDSFVVDEIDNTTDETFLGIEITGLFTSFQFVLHQKAATNGAKVIYRIEVKFF